MPSGDSSEWEEQVPQVGTGWPEHVQTEIDQLFNVDVSEVEGTARLGSLAFSDAPGQIETVRSIVRDLTLEPWEDLPPGFGDGVNGQLQHFNVTLSQMQELSADAPDAQNTRNTMAEQLTSLTNWFISEAKPKAMRAMIDRRLSESGALSPSGDLAELQMEIASARESLAELQAREAQQRKELESRADLVSGRRQEAGASVGEALSTEFARKSGVHKALAEKWLKALVGMGIFAAVVAISTFVVFQRTGGGDSPDFAELGLGLFILGLLAFGVRVCAQNYRVNRHLEAAAWGKATVLSTFQSLVSTAEEGEVRSTIALALAQEVFRADETGLVDGSGDQVTLIERAVSTRIPGSSA